MKKLLFLFFLAGFNSYCQTPKRIKFNYDSAGNQTQRFICITCPTARTIKDSIIKTSENLEEEDMISDAESDQIKYYPNPVLEELYVKWSNTNSTHVVEINLFTLNGQLLKQYSNIKSQNSEKIAFSNYPVGYYNLVLVYNNGEKKNLKIVKQ